MFRNLGKLRKFLACHHHFAKSPYRSETELRIMWWVIGIFGGVCFVAVLLCLLIAGAKKMGEEALRKSILEAIAKEYLVRRQNGETLHQIADSLYKQYPISRPIDFWSGDYNPIPAGQLKFGSLMTAIPEELKQLGKIAYTLLCNRGVYPMPQQGKGPRDSAAEFAALTGILYECLTQMAVLEAAGGIINQDLRATVNKWAEVGDDLASKLLSPSLYDQIRKSQ